MQCPNCRGLVPEDRPQCPNCEADLSLSLLAPDGEEYGPYHAHAVRQYLAEGRVTPEYSASFAGGPWAPLRQVLAAVWPGQPVEGAAEGDGAAAQAAPAVAAGIKAPHPEGYLDAQVDHVGVFSCLKIAVTVSFVLSLPALGLAAVVLREEGPVALAVGAGAGVGGAALAALYAAILLNLICGWLGGIDLTFRHPVALPQRDCEVKSIRPLSALRVGVGGGLVVGGLYLLLVLLTGVLLRGQTLGWQGPVASLALLPPIGALGGAVGGLLLCVIYNVVARVIGGVVLTFHGGRRGSTGARKGRGPGAPPGSQAEISSVGIGSFARVSGLLQLASTILLCFALAIMVDVQTEGEAKTLGPTVLLAALYGVAGFGAGCIYAALYNAVAVLGGLEAELKPAPVPVGREVEGGKRRLEWGAVGGFGALVAGVAIGLYALLNIPVDGAYKEAKAAMAQASPAGMMMSPKGPYLQCLASTSRHRALSYLFPRKCARMDRWRGQALLGLAQADASRGYLLAGAARAQQALSGKLSQDERAAAEGILQYARQAGVSDQAIDAAQGLSARVVRHREQVVGAGRWTKDFKVDLTCEFRNRSRSAVGPVEYVWQVPEFSVQKADTLETLAPGQRRKVSLSFQTTTGRDSISVKEGEVDFVPVRLGSEGG